MGSVDLTRTRKTCGFSGVSFTVFPVLALSAPWQGTLRYATYCFAKRRFWVCRDIAREEAVIHWLAPRVKRPLGDRVVRRQEARRREVEFESVAHVSGE